jgi:hypothetical protein
VPCLTWSRSCRSSRHSGRPSTPRPTFSSRLAGTSRFAIWPRASISTTDRHSPRSRVLRVTVLGPPSRGPGHAGDGSELERPSLTCRPRMWYPGSVGPAGSAATVEENEGNEGIPAIAGPGR